MQLKWGSYSFTANASRISTDSTLEYDGIGNPVSVKHVWSVAGKVFGADQYAVTTAMNDLMAAMQVGGQDLIFAHDDGTEAMFLKNNGSFYGVQFTNGPSFIDGGGAEHATYRSFQFTAEAEYPIGGPPSQLKEFSETLILSGGGPRVHYMEAVNGLPQKQVLSLAQPFHALQTGRAVAIMTSYPVAPAQLWPGALVENPIVSFTGPQNSLDWTTTWEYRFASAYPLLGLPHQMQTYPWVGNQMSTV